MNTPNLQVSVAHNPVFDSDSLVAAVLIAEAGGEGDQGLQAVMNVIANRATKGKITDAEVVLKPKQFSCLNGITKIEDFINTARKHPKWDTALKLVKQAKSGKLPDITGGSTHYYATWMDTKGKTPKWAVGVKGTTIGKQKFLP